MSFTEKRRKNLCFLGAIILGLTTAFGLYIIPKLAVAFGFILMIIVLIIRPWGLMGEPD